MTTSIALFAIHKKKALAELLNKAFTQELISTVSQEFELTNLSMLALISKQSKNFAKDGVMDSIPLDLLEHRYLMHPIRMAIMKLLTANNHLPSFEVRQLLGITWGEYYSHVRSLEEKSHIEMIESFNENSNLVVTIRITDLGRQLYDKFVALLVDFTQKEAPIRRFLNDSNFPIYDTSLYPTSTEKSENNE